MTERQRRSDDGEVDLPSTRPAESDFETTFAPAPTAPVGPGNFSPDASTQIPG